MHPEIARLIAWDERRITALTSATPHHRSTKRRFPRRPARTEDR